MHDLHDRELAGVGVFEDGEGESFSTPTQRTPRWVGHPPGGVDDEFLFVPALVEITEAVVFESGGAALGAVDLEVSAALDVEAERLSEFVALDHDFLVEFG